MYQQIESNKRKTWTLISIFILVIAGIGWFLDYYMDGGYGILVIALVLSVLMSVTSYYKSDKIALWSTGAKEIKKNDSPYVYRMVEKV